MTTLKRGNLKFNCVFVVSFLLIVSTVFAQEVYTDMTMFHLTDSAGKVITRQQLFSKEYNVSVSFNKSKRPFLQFFMDSIKQSVYISASYTGVNFSTDYTKIVVIHKSDTMRILVLADIMPKDFRPYGDTYFYENDTVKASYEIRFNKGNFIVVESNSQLQILEYNQSDEPNSLSSYQLHLHSELNWNKWSEEYWITVPPK